MYPPYGSGCPLLRSLLSDTRIFSRVVLPATFTLTVAEVVLKSTSLMYSVVVKFFWSASVLNPVSDTTLFFSRTYDKTFPLGP